MPKCNQGSSTTGGHSQLTQGRPTKHLVLVTERIVLLDTAGHLLPKATLSRPANVLIYLIHKKKKHKDRQTRKIEEYVTNK